MSSTSKTPDLNEGPRSSVPVIAGSLESGDAHNPPSNTGPIRGRAEPRLFGFPSYQPSRPGKRYDYEHKYEPDVMSREKKQLIMLVFGTSALTKWRNMITTCCEDLETLSILFSSSPVCSL